MAWRLHNRSWRDGGGRSCRAETQRVTQPDTPLSTGPSAPAGGAVVPSLGTPQLKSCTTGSCPQSRARLFLRRGGEGPRGRHALPVGKPTSTNLLRRTPNWQCSQTPALRATPHALRPPHICHVISQGKRVPPGCASSPHLPHRSPIGRALRASPYRWGTRARDRLRAVRLIERDASARDVAATRGRTPPIARGTVSLDSTWSSKLYL
jgi:hypothetical protein